MGASKRGSGRTEDHSGVDAPDAGASNGHGGNGAGSADVVGQDAQVSESAGSTSGAPGEGGQRTRPNITIPNAATVHRKVPGIGRSYHGIRRTGLALLFLPVFALVALADMIEGLAYRLHRREARAQPARVNFRRPASMPANPEERSVADVLAELQKFPFEPIHTSARVAFYQEFAHEGLGVLFHSQPALAALPHLYPGVFRPRLFTGYDGVQLAGLQAMHESRGPALILCHGLLTNKNFDYIRQLARKAYSEWGFHVIAIDLRSWGQSSWTSEAPSSAGYFEGMDVLEIARELKRHDNVTSVGVMGFSLGGCTALNAARHASHADDDPLDGGVLAVCAPSVVSEAVDMVSTRPHWRHPFFGMWVVFGTVLRTGVRRMGLSSRLSTWRDLVRHYGAPWYGVDEHEFMERASAVNWADEIDVPTLELHAADDFVVPVEHAWRLRDAAPDNPNLGVWVVDKGNHCAFSTVDRRWFFSVTRRWFEYWATE